VVLVAYRKSADKKDNDKTCRYCKEVKGWAGRGHEKAECFTKKREKTKENEKVDTTEDSEKDDEYISIVEINIVADMNNGWQYDTGASTLTANLTYRLTKQKKTKIMITDNKSKAQAELICNI
jgi:hypothetical protein